MSGNFRHSLEYLLNPYIWLLLLIGILRWKRQSNFVWLGMILVVFLLGTMPLPKSLIGYLESQYSPVETYNAHVKYIVVLGGGQAEGLAGNAIQLLTSASIKRVFEAERLYHDAGGHAKLIFSGANSNDGFSEAENMRKLALKLGVSARDILVEKNSENTRSQAKNIKAMIGDKTFYLVTSAIHMPRTERWFKSENLSYIPAPTDYNHYWDDDLWQKKWIPNAYNLAYLMMAMHEIWGTLLWKIQS